MTQEIVPSSYREFGCIAFEGVSLGPGLPANVDMGDNQRIVFKPPVELDEHWRADIGNYQFQHLSKSNFAVELTQPEGATSYDAIASRLWGTIYAILLFGMPRLRGGLEVLGTRYSEEVAVHRVATPYQMYFCPWATAAVVSGNSLMRAKVIASELRAIHAPGAGYFRLRSGLAAWLMGVRSEHGDERAHQFVRAVEAVVKPEQAKTREQFVRRCASFATNRDVLDELFNLRSATEHMNDYSPFVTGKREWTVDRRGWFRSFQAELLVQTVYTRILSDRTLGTHFSTDENIDRFWNMDGASRLALWGRPVNLNELAGSRFA